MVSFVRKNLLLISGVFDVPGQPDTDQPQSVVCELSFLSLNGTPTTASLNMSFNSETNVWSCLWDSSAARAGSVSWVVFGSGGVQAAAQGQFQLQANAANNF